MKTSKHVTGVITAAQEHRFWLQDDAGKYRLYILTHDADQEWHDLEALAQAGTHVLVRYTDADRVIAAAAQSITVLDTEPPTVQ